MKKMKAMLLAAMVFFAAGTLTAQEGMSYYFSKTVKGSFEDVVEKTKAALKAEGFGVITEVDMDTKLKEKLDNVEMGAYKILGVCNPGYAYQTIRAEENIGLFLPCKVLVKDLGDGRAEVVMVDALAVMKMLGNDDLLPIAEKVSGHFKTALENIK